MKKIIQIQRLKKLKVKLIVALSEMNQQFVVHVQKEVNKQNLMKFLILMSKTTIQNGLFLISSNDKYYVQDLVQIRMSNTQVLSLKKMLNIVLIQMIFIYIAINQPKELWTMMQKHLSKEFLQWNSQQYIQCNSSIQVRIPLKGVMFLLEINTLRLLNIVDKFALKAQKNAVVKISKKDIYHLIISTKT